MIRSDYQVILSFKEVSLKTSILDSGMKQVGLYLYILLPICTSVWLFSINPYPATLNAVSIR